MFQSASVVNSGSEENFSDDDVEISGGVVMGCQIFSGAVAAGAWTAIITAARSKVARSFIRPEYFIPAPACATKSTGVRRDAQW